MRDSCGWEKTAAEKVQNALEFVYRKKKDKLTRDVGGEAGTSEFADTVLEAMEQVPETSAAGR